MVNWMSFMEMIIQVIQVIQLLSEFVDFPSNHSIASCDNCLALFRSNFYQILSLAQVLRSGQVHSLELDSLTKYGHLQLNYFDWLQQMLIFLYLAIRVFSPKLSTQLWLVVQAPLCSSRPGLFSCLWVLILFRHLCALCQNYLNLFQSTLIYYNAFMWCMDCLYHCLQEPLWIPCI